MKEGPRKEELEAKQLNSASAEEIFAIYRERGRIDLSILNKEKLAEVKNEYKRLFDQLSTESQTEIFEQFLATDAVSDLEAEMIFEKIRSDPTNGSEEAMKVGEYIFNVGIRGKYLKIFHQCLRIFEEHNFEKGVEIAIKLRSEKNYKSLLMVLPNLHLLASLPREKEVGEPRLPPHKIRELQKSKEEELKKTTSNEEKGRYIEKYFNNFESAKTLLDTALIMEDKWAAERILSEAVRFYSEQNLYFLLPYLPKIREVNPSVAKIIDNKIQEGLKIETWRAWHLIPSGFFETKEEKGRLVEIFKQLGGVVGKELLFSTDDARKDSLSQKLKREKLEIEDGISLRKAEFLLTNFPQYTSSLSAQEKFKILATMLECQVPVIAYVEKTGLSDKDLKVFIKRTLKDDDTKIIFKMNGALEIEKLVKMGLEKEAAAIIISDIELADYWELHDTLRLRIINNIEKIFSLVSEKSKNKIISAINAKIPTMWIENLDYAIDNNIISFENLQRLIAGNPDKLIRYYPNLLYKLRKIEPDDRRFREKREILRNTAKLSIKKYIAHFLNDVDKRKIISTIISETELGEIITEGLENPEGGLPLAMEILRSFSDSKKKQSDHLLLKYGDPARKIVEEVLKKNPGMLFNEFLYDWDNLVRSFSERGLLKYLTNDIESINLSRLLDDYAGGKIVEALIRHPYYINKFLDYLTTKDGIYHIASFLGSLFEFQKELNRKKNGPNELKDARPPIDQEALKEILGKCIASYEKAIKENRFLVFEWVPKSRRDIIKDNPTTKQIVLEQSNLEVSEYLKQFPNEVGSVLDIVETNQNLYNKILVDNINLIFFSSKKYIYETYEIYDERLLTEKTEDLICEIDPIKQTEREARMRKLQKDFYEIILKKIKELSTFKLYEKQLTILAKHEVEINGEQLEKPKNLNSEFIILAKKLLLLNSCKWFVKNIDQILKRNKHDQAKIIKLAEMSVLYKIEHEEEFELTESALVKLGEKITKTFVAKIRQTLQIEIDSDLQTKASPDLLDAILIYYTSSCRKDREMSRAIKSFVPKILDDNYGFDKWWNKNKNKTDGLEELKSLKLLPAKITLAQYESWTQDAESSLRENLSISLDDLTENIRKTISQAIFDNHINKESVDQTRDDLLSKYKSMASELSEFRKRADLDGEKEFVSEHGKTIDKLRALLYLSAIRNISASELERNVINFNGKDINLNQAWKNIEKGLCGEFPEFKTDVEKLKQLADKSRENLFGGDKISKTELSITDKFDPEIYFYIGENPVPSCQNYNSRTEGGLNFGLLAYEEDPNIKIVQVYNESDVLISRSIMRLLEDENGYPHLFLERVYSVNPHPKIEEAIINFAKRKAEIMKVGLYSETIVDMESESDLYQHGTLYSRGSRAPYVYTDSGGGRKKDGVYSVVGRKIV